MDKCPVCGSSLIWVYEEGVVVCSSCGLVVDRVFDYTPTFSLSEEKPKRRPAGVKGLDKRAYKIKLKLYSRAYKISRERPWMVVDTDKVLETGRLVHTVKSKASLLAEENIEREGVRDYVEKGLEIISRENPALLARSLRGRYALAYMVAYASLSGEMPPEDFVVKVFNISSTSFKRLRSIVRGLQEKHGWIRQETTGEYEVGDSQIFLKIAT
ncbi:MAG: TFIIB-type zinc ribbon-containing protein [Thermogladius sp.]|jgi:transcription initiation factor TFIIIB Brf1 subunit/transcription initiation factor TFIIB|nr:TFIIB-type zinc ribbon-containing protein [Thermogladius sp.]